MCAMTGTQASAAEWNKRQVRATELASDNPAAAELMRFYSAVLKVQADIFAAAADRFTVDAARPLRAQINEEFAASNLPAVCKAAEKHGPRPLADAARLLRQRPAEHWAELLNGVVSNPLYDPENIEQFFARAVLQPIAESLARQLPTPNAYTGSACPYCDGAPQCGVLRTEGDGGKRFLLCSFCLREWEFRRIVCAWCGEEDHHKLPRFGTDELKHVTVFGCDVCKHYLKGVDLTVTGLAVPLVDEIASAPLDLWAAEHGYSKIVPNLMGI